MCDCVVFFFFQAEDGIRDDLVTGVQTCALPISVFGPAEVKHWPVHASTGEVLHSLLAVPGEYEVMRDGAVFTAADERHPPAIRRDADVVKGSTRGEGQCHGIGCFAVASGSIREAKEKNALGILIRLEMIP